MVTFVNMKWLGFLSKSERKRRSEDGKVVRDIKSSLNY